jgi:hypothetical protein
MTGRRAAAPCAPCAPCAGWILIALLAAAPALAECDPDTRARLDYIEKDLEDAEGYADWWWRLWTGGYAFGTVLTSVQAALVEGGDRAVAIVSASKALIGTTRLAVWPPHARLGADELLDMPDDTPEACRARLRRAEEILEKNAREARRAFRWYSHAVNVGLNVAGALIAGEAFDHRGPAWVSAGIGLVVGEAQIWSSPFHARGDLERYREHFSGPKTRLHLEPHPNLAGAQLRIEF